MAKSLVAAVLASALVLAPAAKAATVFSENFDGEAAGGSALNFTGFDQFTVTQGFVDIIASGGFSIDCVGNTGGCVDLDGSASSNPVSTLTSALIAFSPGFTYTLSFDVSGNQRGGASDTTQVSISNGVLGPQSFTLAPGAPFQTLSFNFTVSSLTSAAIVFLTPGTSDSFGLILDNVRIESNGALNGVIPLPAAAPLFGAGLVALGLFRRRRRG